MRYEGSRWNRTNGIGLDATKTTINPLPVRPTTPTVLSWKVDFPAYAPFEGKRQKMVLNKMNQACPGLDDAVGERVYGDPGVNVPVQKTRYSRLHINGGYYHYMIDGSSPDGIAQLLGTERSHGDPMSAPLLVADFEKNHIRVRSPL